MSDRLIIRTTGQTGPSGGGGGGGGTTNLAYTAGATNGVVTSDTGTDATIPLADATNAGLMTPAQRNAVNALATTYQPLDSDLTAIAALSTTSYGRALLTLANLAALQAAVGPTGTPSASTFLRGDGSWATPAGGGGGDLLASNNLSDVANAATALANLGGQPLDSDLTAIAALTTTSYGRAFLALADAAAARTALALGTIATQAASAVSITGGSITGITDLAVADGGTGASDAATARANLGVVAASDTASGLVELATTAETTTGTDAVRAVTPAGLLNATTASNINARIGVEKAGSLVGTRRRINFIDGTNVTITVADDSVNEEVDVTIAASGGGGSSIARQPRNSTITPFGVPHTGVPGMSLFGSGASVAMSADNVFYFPMVVLGADITITAAAVNIASAASAGNTVRLSLYNADGNWLPTTLVADFGTVAADSTGRKAITGLSQTVTQGYYLARIHAQASCSVSRWTGLCPWWSQVPIGATDQPSYLTTTRAYAAAETPASPVPSTFAVVVGVGYPFGALMFAW